MPLFVKFATVRPEISEEDVAALDERFSVWVKEIKSKGTLIITGPFESRLNGMTVLQADNQAEAMKTFETDPFNSLFSSWQVHVWRATDFEKK